MSFLNTFTCGRDDPSVPCISPKAAFCNAYKEMALADHGSNLQSPGAHEYGELVLCQSSLHSMRGFVAGDEDQEKKRKRAAL